MRNWFSGLMGVAVVGLCVLCLLLLRQNAGLRRAVADRDAAMAARASAEGLRAGDTVGGLALFDGEGGAVDVGFGAGEAPALVFLVTTGCEACEAAMPVWDTLVGSGVMGARVVCVDASVRDASGVVAHSAVIPTLWAEDPRWLRDVPVTPGVVVVAGDGRVVGVWYGARAATRVDEIRAALHDASVGG